MYNITIFKNKVDFLPAMSASCSLDEFIEKNMKEVRVDPYSLPIEFPSLDYKVPAGALFDLRVLRGEGYVLQATSLKEEADINPCDIGGAVLLDKGGKKTGYQLIQHGSNHPDGSHHFSAYFIGRTPNGPLDDDGLERYRAVTKKFGDVLWGPKDK